MAFNWGCVSGDNDLNVFLKVYRRFVIKNHNNIKKKVSFSQVSLDFYVFSDFNHCFSWNEYWYAWLVFCSAVRATYTRNSKLAKGKTSGQKGAFFCPFSPISPRKSQINFILLAVVDIDKDNNAEEFINADPTEVKCPEHIIRKRKNWLFNHWNSK